MGKVYNLGHRALEELFDGSPLVIQEKVDGSQCQFAWNSLDQFTFRSKNVTIVEDDVYLADGNAFQPAIDHLMGIPKMARPVGLIFRAECVTKPRHHTLTYDRVPRGGLVIFDILDMQMHLSPKNGFFIKGMAGHLGVEAVPEFKTTLVKDLGELQELAQRESFLGGPKMEGVVIKNYLHHDPITSKYPLMGKFVRPEFREKHSRQWKKDQPGRKDVLIGIIDSLNTEARFEKAVQYLRDSVGLDDSPKDIGPLMKRVKQDVMEEIDWITEQLVGAFIKDIERGIGRGLPEWYKDRLAQSQFD